MAKSIMVKQPKGGNFELVPADNHLARCFSIVQLGEQISEFSGKTVRRSRIRITWELPDALKSDGKPHVIGEEYTMSLSSKGNLKPALESWRGRPFTAEELDGFDITSILGVGCLLNVIHKASKDGTKTYALISSIGKLPARMELPPQVNESVVFTVEDFGNKEELEKLPEFVQEKIKASVEYAGEPAPKDEIPVVQEAPAQRTLTAHPDEQDKNDDEEIRIEDVPF